MPVVYQLGSGSGGNLTAVVGPEGLLLVDAGFPAREIVHRLGQAGLEGAHIKALVLTHAHLDHARGAALLARRRHIPIWATSWTLRHLKGLKGGEQLNVLEAGVSVTLAGLTLATCPVQHDLPGTVIVRIADRLGIATDLGVITPEVASFLSGLEGLLLEFNHDETLLREGPYPVWLQERILSDKGHLANAQAASLLSSSGFSPPTRALWLAHLSQHNNRPEIALAAAEEALGRTGPEFVVSQQERACPPIQLG